MKFNEEQTEGKLSSIEALTLKSNDADFIKKLKDFKEPAHFIMVDFNVYNKTLEKLKGYVK